MKCIFVPRTTFHNYRYIKFEFSNENADGTGPSPLFKITYELPDVRYFTAEFRTEKHLVTSVQSYDQLAAYLPHIL